MNDIPTLVDQIEIEAHRRAAYGHDEPIYQGGVQVGTVTKYNEKLVTFLLKAGKPERYADLNSARKPLILPKIVDDKSASLAVGLVMSAFSRRQITSSEASRVVGLIKDALEIVKSRAVSSPPSLNIVDSE